MVKIAPARLYALIPKNSRNAIVFRRGPSNKVCTIRWDRSEDTFHLGQWLTGRIHVHCSDISPDGKYLLYSASDFRKHSGLDVWTAISYVPYLKGICVWECFNSYYIGGLFTGNKSYWIDTYMREERLEEIQSSDELIEDLYFSPPDSDIYFSRLLRDGWTWISQRIPHVPEHVSVFQKKVDKFWDLRMIGDMKYQTLNESKEICHDYYWDWAEIDGDRLVWAENGQLWCGYFGNRELGETRMLYDFNDMKYQKIKAPY